MLVSKQRPDRNQKTTLLPTNHQKSLSTETNEQRPQRVTTKGHLFPLPYPAKKKFVKKKNIYSKFSEQSSTFAHLDARRVNWVVGLGQRGHGDGVLGFSLG